MIRQFFTALSFFCLQAILGLPLKWKVGEDYHYSNDGYIKLPDDKTKVIISLTIYWKISAILTPSVFPIERKEFTRGLKTRRHPISVSLLEAV